MTDINSWQQRFTLICKPEQSGKTFIMIQQIIKDLKEKDQKGKKTVNFIFCDNSLLLTKQTGERVKNDLEEYQVNGELYIELSSHNRTEHHDWRSVVGTLATSEVNNVLCCTNGVRVDDIYEIIQRLNNYHLTENKFMFKIWLDEGDKFIKPIDSTFKPLVDEYENVNVYCITATPKKLFDVYKLMNVFPIENTTTPNYHGWNDNEITLVDHVPGNDFVRHVLDECAKVLIVPGSKWFIPAGHTKKSHTAVKDICIERGIATFIVNGEGIQLYFPNKIFHIFNKDEELNTLLKKIYKQYHLDNFPVAITGNICIGRGISIVSEDFMFDCGILSLCNNQQEASQNSGRLKGNIKGFSTYKPFKVFTTKHFDEVAKEWENKSRGLAELAFKRAEEGQSTIITKNEFKTVGENFEYIVHDELFISYADAQRFLVTKQREMNTKTKASKKCVIHSSEATRGYMVTSKLLKGGKSVEDLSYEDVLTIEKAKAIAPSTCISSTDKGSRYLILPVYENESTPANKAKYQVRYISFKKDCK